MIPSSNLYAGTVYFNGNYLHLYNKVGTLLFRVPAISGNAGFNGPEYQFSPNQGPIVEGRYALDPGAIYFRGENPINVLLNREFGSRIAWGDARTQLIPLEGQFSDGSRSGFNLHGGGYAGSNGCIDLLNNEVFVLNEIRKLAAGGNPVEVIVNYSDFNKSLADQLIERFNPVTGVSAIADRPPATRCFLAGTPILLPDGTERPIETIAVGDRVAAFAGGGAFDGARALGAALEGRAVTRLFANVTREVIGIRHADPETGAERTVYATPGHVMLTGRTRTNSEESAWWRWQSHVTGLS